MIVLLTASSNSDGDGDGDGENICARFSDVNIHTLHCTQHYMEGMHTVQWSEVHAAVGKMI